MNGAQSLAGLWPVWASAHALSVDEVILAFTLVTLALTVPIFVAITYFAYRYRTGKIAYRGYSEERSVLIEMSWMLIPFFLTLIFFFWAARLFDAAQHPPPGAMTVDAIGKQWMWKFQHPTGQAEINDLHVPVDTDVRVNMISQDVIHSLYVPALRIQAETLPNRYTQIWFHANRVGSYHLFCSEFCGTDHSVMDGNLTVMSQADYEHWLSQSGSTGTVAEAGGRLFSAYGCSGCHGVGSQVWAPNLVGLYMRPVPMQEGGTVTADDAYLRDKILYPDHHLIAGYEQKMPTFAGRLSESDLLQLIAYIRSLGSEASGAGNQSPRGQPEQRAARESTP